MNEEKLKRLCRLMFDNNVNIVIHDNQQAVKIDWMVVNPNQSTRDLEDLVYRDEDTGKIISKLRDGTYGADQLYEIATEEGKKNAN